MVRSAYSEINIDDSGVDFDSLKISPFNQSVFYGIFEECLMNTVKHSKAENIQIFLSKKDEHLEFSILDNGVGFDIENTENWGLGIKNIKSRVHYLNGKIKWISPSSGGTEVKVIIPLKDQLEPAT